MNLTKFFQKWLLPLRRSYFPRSFDKGAASYFIVRKNPRMTREMFELGSNISFANLENRLADFWSENGNPELKPLAKPLAELAKSVYSIENQSDEVSPFSYVMY